MSELLDEGYLLRKDLEVINERIKREWNTDYFGDDGFEFGYWLDHKIDHDLNFARRVKLANMLVKELQSEGYSARVLQSHDYFVVYVRVEEKKV